MPNKDNKQSFTTTRQFYMGIVEEKPCASRSLYRCTPQDGKAGFTLVELSIVLVIIGLLIGGILVGQSLIDSAQLSSTIRQLQQYDIAVRNFDTKYNAIPGDSSLFCIHGDNDGLLEADSAGTDTVYSEEFSCFWKDLSTSKMISEEYISSGTNVTPGLMVPEISLGLDSGLLAGRGNEPADVFGPNVNIYNIRKPPTLSRSLYTSGGGGNSLLVSEAMSLDAKIDDGIANNGTVIATEGANELGQTASTLCANTASYNVNATNGYYCSVEIKILFSQ